MRIATILWLWLFAICGAASAVHARTPDGRISLGPACVLSAPADEDVASIYARRHHATCRIQPVGKAPVQWGVFDRLSFANVETEPLRFIHAISRESGEVVYTRHADGQFRKSSTTPAQARQILSSADVRFDLPRSDSPITAILVRTVNFQSERGVAPRAAVETHASAERTARLLHLFYGLIGGLLLTLLAYNLMLYAVLRHRFLLIYCLTSAAMLGFGFVWSGGVFLAFPAMTTSEQASLNFLTVALVMLIGPAFQFSFVEHNVIPRWLKRAIYGAGWVLLASALVRLARPQFAWQAMDVLSYGGMFAVVCGVLIASAIAWRNGSRAIRIYLLGWISLLLMVQLRVLWGLGYETPDSQMFDMAPFAAMAIEAVISTVAMVMRISALQSERDEARVLHAQMRILAETDPMTGLLNRRAFVERAQLGSHGKRLILSDIDRFKAINDSQGHDVGDRVIIAVAHALRNASPPGALVGRIGGEEFAVLVPADADGDLADRLRIVVETPAFDGGPPVTISAGVAEHVVTSEADWRLLYIAADQALYEAKRAGRNRVKYAFAALTKPSIAGA